MAVGRLMLPLPVAKWPLTGWSWAQGMEGASLWHRIMAMDREPLRISILAIAQLR